MKATTIQVEENACAMEQNRKRHGTHELLSHSKYVLCPFLLVPLHRHFPSGSKDMQEICRRPGFNSWVRKIPSRREWRSTPVFLPGVAKSQTGLSS